MKKTFLILAILIASAATSFAQDWYKTTALSVKVGQRNYSDWYDCPSSLSINTETKEIIVYNDVNVSSETNGTFSIDYSAKQYFYYTGINNYTYDKYKLQETVAYDGYSKKVTIYLYSYYDGRQFLVISYNNIKFQYRIKPY
jgi:hypothetical protein